MSIAKKQIAISVDVATLERIDQIVSESKLHLTRSSLCAFALREFVDKYCELPEQLALKLLPGVKK